MPSPSQLLEDLAEKIMRPGIDDCTSFIAVYERHQIVIYPRKKYPLFAPQICTFSDRTASKGFSSTKWDKIYERIIKCIQGKPINRLLPLTYQQKKSIDSSTDSSKKTKLTGNT